MIGAFLHGLESCFAWLLEASWQASVLVALVLLLQLVLRGRLNPRWHHALWLLVLARLILPALPESALSVFQFTPHPPATITETVTEPIFAAPPPVPVHVPSLPSPAPGYPFSICTLLALVWLAGALGLLLLTWLVNRRFARHVAQAPSVIDSRLMELAAAAQGELGLHRRLRIIESGQVQSPAIMGLFRPTLILPKGVRARFSDAELRFIFLHEFAHLKRGDLILQWIVALLQILHWFNPVLWYAFRRMRADREPATDALVLSCTGEEQKESYGQVLVKLLEHYHTRHSLPTLVGILEDKDQFKRRFSLIAKFTRGAYGWSLLGVLLIGAVAMAGLTKAESSSSFRSADDLATAVQKGDATAARKLIDEGANPRALDENGRTLLFDAASPEVAELLISKGVDPKFQAHLGETALSVISLNGGKNTAAIARVLLQHGADPNSRSGQLKCTPIMGAVNGATVDVLVQFGADVHAVDSYGESALYWSTWQDISTFQALLKHGFPFDAKKDGPSILVHATWNGNLPLVSWLLEHGVDPNTAGVFAHPKNGKDDMMLPMEAVAICGRSQAGKLLLEHGAKGEPATEIALQNHYSNIVRLLWDHGVRNISELCYAISQNAPLSDLEGLLQKGGSADAPQDTVITPLGEAAENDNLPAVQLLVQHGANVNAGGSADSEHPENRDTPLKLAAERGQDEIVVFLLEHGAEADPDVLSYGVIAGIPNSFYVGTHHLPSKEHYEKVVQLLIDAGGLKGTDAAWTGRLLEQALFPCWGDPDPVILQKLLAAGLSPAVPMPHLAENGEKPNTVIGYYRDYYQKRKNDPTYAGPADEIKPLLDLLEAADKSAKASTDTQAPAAARTPTSPSDARLIRTETKTALDARRVIGQWTRGPNLPADVDVAKNVIVILSPKLPPPPAPASADTRAKGQKWVEAWYKTGEGKKYVAASNRRFLLKLKANGTFSGEHVEPGDYILSGAFWDRGQLRAQTQDIPVTVPKNSDHDPDAPVDLGYIVISGAHLDAYVTAVQVKFLNNNPATPAPSEAGALVPQTYPGAVTDEGRLYHALVYEQSGSSARLAIHPYQFIADIRNTVPGSLGSVSLPAGASWSTNPVQVVDQANLIGAHYLYKQGFDSLDALMANFPHGYYVFKITREPLGGEAKSFEVPVAFDRLAIPGKAPVIKGGKWSSGALVLSPSSAVIHYDTEPGVSMSWEIVGAGGSTGGWGSPSDGILNLTGMLAPGQTYDGQLRLVRLDNSMTVADPVLSSNCVYSTLTASIVQFTIKTAGR